MTKNQYNAGLVFGIMFATNCLALTQLDQARAGPIESFRCFVADSLDQIWPDEIEFDPADATYWLELFDNALREQDVETLAELSPYAHEAYDYAASIPLLRPLAAWLKPRLDYFELAEAAARQIQPAPVAPFPPPPKKPNHAPPLHKPLPRYTLLPPRPNAAIIQTKRRQALRNPENWQKKMAGRNPPANAGDLLPQLKDIFKQEGAPPELVWMAEVESSFNPQAKSPAGAVGLFQLMPPTARQYGLNVDSTDDRRDVRKNTRAAARHLKSLYKQFGSWPLAMAAYNCGNGRLNKIIKQTGGKTFEEIADALPLETQMYVPKVMATIKLREKIDPSTLPPPF